MFVGPLLFIPEINQGNVASVEVYSPRNGHPIGATFVPGVIYSDAELDDPESERWPAMESFSLLDPHGYSIELTQTSPRRNAGTSFPASAIPATNHKVKGGRKMTHAWDVAVAVRGQLSGWSSHRLIEYREGIYVGSDAPTTTVSTSHRLTYEGVTGAEFCGASAEAKEYLKANISKGGTLIIVGEIPYQSSLLHEREAVSSLAKLAGLDLHLAAVTPPVSRARVTGHLIACGFSVVMV